MKRIKLYEEFLAAEPQREVAPTRPVVKPETPTKPAPSRPSPIPTHRPDVDPTPKASEEDVINRFADELDSLSEEDKEDYARILKKYNKK